MHPADHLGAVEVRTHAHLKACEARVRRGEGCSEGGGPQGGCPGPGGRGDRLVPVSSAFAIIRTALATVPACAEPVLPRCVAFSVAREGDKKRYIFHLLWSVREPPIRM